MEAKRKYSRPLFIFCFFLLYIYQGFQFGLNEAFRQILKAKHLDDGELSWLSLSSSPFYMKFLIAPFMDVYFSRKIGKRFTWIIPTTILSCAIYFATAQKIEDLLEQKDAFSLFVINFIQILLIATQDVAIDGMVCEILNPEDYEKGSLMQTLGQMVGPMVACNVFNILISPEFAKQKLGLDSQLVSVPTFIRMMGFFVAGSTTFTFFMMNESHITSTEQTGVVHTEQSFGELIRMIPSMFLNKNIRNLLLIPLLFESFLLFSDSSNMLKLIDKGFDLLFLNELELVFFAVDLLVIFMMSKLRILENVWKIYQTCHDILFGAALLFWFFYYFVSLEENRNLWVGFLIAFKIIKYLSLVKFTSLVVFQQYVADKRYGGSYLTINASVNNFSRMNIPYLLLRLTGYVGFDYVLAAVLVYDLVFRLVFRSRWIEYFKKSSPEDFALEKIGGKKKEE